MGHFPVLLWGPEYQKSFLGVPAPPAALSRTCLPVPLRSLPPRSRRGDCCCLLLSERLVLWAVGSPRCSSSSLGLRGGDCSVLLPLLPVTAHLPQVSAGVSEGRQFSASPLMAADLRGLREDLCLPRLQEQGNFAWVLEAGRFPLLCSGAGG